MNGPLRRVAIDDEAATYVSEGPELVADDDGSYKHDYEDYDSGRDNLAADVEVLTRQYWSAQRIADELGLSVDRVLEQIPEEDLNADAIAYAYGTGTEEGTKEGE